MRVHWLPLTALAASPPRLQPCTPRKSKHQYRGSPMSRGDNHTSKSNLRETEAQDERNRGSSSMTANLVKCAPRLSNPLSQQPSYRSRGCVRRQCSRHPSHTASVLRCVEEDGDCIDEGRANMGSGWGSNSQGPSPLYQLRDVAELAFHLVQDGDST